MMPNVRKGAKRGAGISPARIQERGLHRQTRRNASAIRASVLCLMAAWLGLLAGCCGISGGVCQTYQHPDPSCVGLHYEGCCTCRDEWRDRVNQLTDIFLP